MASSSKGTQLRFHPAQQKLKAALKINPGVPSFPPQEQSFFHQRSMGRAGLARRARLGFCPVLGSECAPSQRGEDTEAAQGRSRGRRVDNKALCWLSCQGFLLQAGQRAQSLQLSWPVPPALRAPPVSHPAWGFRCAATPVPLPGPSDQHQSISATLSPSRPFPRAIWVSLATHPQIVIPKKEPHRVLLFWLPLFAGCPSCSASLPSPPGHRVAPARHTLHFGAGEGNAEAAGGGQGSPGAVHGQPCQVHGQPDTARSLFLISPSLFPCPKHSWPRASRSPGIQLLICEARRSSQGTRGPALDTQEHRRMLGAELNPLTRVK